MHSKVIRTTSKEDLEKELNKFTSTHNVIDIKFEVVKNFLPYTQQGEYEEIFYALILFVD